MRHPTFAMSKQKPLTIKPKIVIMKKFIFSMLIVLVSFSAINAAEEVIPENVLNAFNAEFETAKDVNWTKSDDFFKAVFSVYGQQVAAFYSIDGNFLAATRNISVTQLPLKLVKTVKEKIAGNYWVTDCFELTTTSGTNYYVTFVNTDSELVMKSIDGNHWTVYDKKRRKK